MKCPSCKEKRPKKDFLGKKICYKCEYRRKCNLPSMKKAVRFCRVCGEKCETSRWVYCTPACSDVGRAQQKKDYWTMKLRGIY